jgi:glycosyltransferase involved in cell wall biosynthesis
MFVSVIICTYRRVDATRTLLECLMAQRFRNFEVLVVDGSGDGSSARVALEESVSRLHDRMDVRLIASRKGLTVQRNVALDRAIGDLIVFLDDDVSFDASFLTTATELFERPDMRDVGGVAGYDVRNFPQPVNLRWRIRAALGVVPALEPGKIDRLGRSVPVSFMKPFAGCKPMGYLYGFCMLYRREAIGELRFDENLPTYGGEDRDFSSRIGKRWRLVMCGDLRLEHHCAPQSRDSGIQRTFQAGFGTGRSFGKNASRILDYLELLRVIVCEFALDALICVRQPSRDRLLTPFARTWGFLAGLRSFYKHAGETS